MMTATQSIRPAISIRSRCVFRWWFAWTLLLGPIGSGAIEPTEIGPIRITVSNLDQALKFYTQVLTFRHLGSRDEHGPQLRAWTGIAGGRTRVALLQLGEERLELVDWLNADGRRIPGDSTSQDLWFQHIAIVVRDMDRAYAHLRRHHVRHVSTGPQTLPEWNPDAGGIKAFYFRDPDDHVLEVLWFPEGKGDPKWQQRVPAGAISGDSSAPAKSDQDDLFLGIDHTAIVVRDTERSLAFYAGHLGLRVAGRSENHGTEQERLNQVFGARVRITSLRGTKGPGIEFLDYLAPPGGRPIPDDRSANDLSFWVVRIKGGHTEAGPPELLLDPDGHALLRSPW